jgi:hypothetical protein
MLYSYQESRALGSALKNSLTQIERDLLPKDPATSPADAHELARQLTLAPLLLHAAYEAAVRAKNPRKVAFWAEVNSLGARLNSGDLVQSKNN